MGQIISWGFGWFVLNSLALNPLLSMVQADIGPPGVHLGQPLIGGSGCLAGDASAVLSPDASTLSILFDRYVVETGVSFGKNIDRKTCEIEIPIQIPKGFSASVMRVDYRGFNALPGGAQSRFTVEYYFTGNHGPSFLRSFYGPLQDDFTVTNQFTTQRPAWSPCGWDAPLRINSSMLLQGNPQQEHAMATVDSADVQAALVYEFKWRQCQGIEPRPQTHPFPAPGTYLGNCSIDQNPSNPNHFLVRNIYMNLVGQATNYQAALHIAELADRDGKCLGQTGSGNVRCVLTVAGRNFLGEGPNQATASSIARSQCISFFHQPQLGNSGQMNCR